MTRSVNIIKTPRPVFYLMGKQAQGNSHPRTWTVISSSTDSEFILNELEALALNPKTSLYYTELMLQLGMGSVDL